MAVISQREARRLRRRVEALEEAIRRQRRLWSQEHPGGTQIRSVEGTPETIAVLRTAAMLRHAIVVVTDTQTHTMRFVALPLPSEGV
jgi:hypothetical protein